MKKNLTRTILITGASSGIGEALALYFAEHEKARIYLTGRNADRLREVADKCRALGSDCFTNTIDVTDRAAMKSWIEEIDDTTPLDLVIANAGISGGPGGEGLARNYDVDLEIFDVNLNGVLNTLHPVISRMVNRKRGQLAIISSVASFAPLAGAPAYSASKAAVRFYGEALSLKLKTANVFLSVVCPGFVVSRMTELNRFPMPFIMPADRAASIIATGLEQHKIRIDFPWQMKLVMSLARLLPEAFIRDIFAQAPEKHSHKNTLPPN